MLTLRDIVDDYDSGDDVVEFVGGDLQMTYNQIEETNLGIEENEMR